MSKKNSSVKVVEPKSEVRAYVGPTIPGVALHGTVYSDGIPKPLQDAVDAKPILGKLIVKLSDFSKAQTSIIRKTGVYYEAYKSI